MYYIKNSVFQYLTPRQKSALLSYVRSFTKKHKDLSKENIINKFIENETYYFEINNSRFEFIKDYLSNEEFLRDLKIYIEAIFMEIEEKERLKPLLEKQKEIQKQQRKKLQDLKMSKQKPTKKQLFLYDKVAKAHGIEKKDIENATRLDLRNWIMEIIDDNEQTDNDKNPD